VFILSICSNPQRAATATRSEIIIFIGLSTRCGPNLGWALGQSALHRDDERRRFPRHGRISVPQVLFGMRPISISNVSPLAISCWVIQG
jgi:hypothetical protein